MRGIVVACAVSAFAPSLCIGQQMTPVVERGRRIRVTAPAVGVYGFDGRFAGLRGDTLVVAADSSLAFPLTHVQRLEVHSGRRAHRLAGFAVLGLTAGVAGAALAAHINESSGDACGGEGEVPCAFTLP